MACTEHPPALARLGAAALALVALAAAPAEAQDVDLAVVLADAPDPVAPGGDLTYTATVINQTVGVSATNVSLALTLPDEVGFVSASASSLVCTTPAVGMSGMVACTTGFLGPTLSTSVTVRVTAPATEATLVLHGAASADQVDADPSDDAANEPTLVGSAGAVDAGVPPGGGPGTTDGGTSTGGATGGGPTTGG
jgi:uncharacterized repeat protein (TIGR01451 family)